MAVSIRWSDPWARIAPPVAPRVRISWLRVALQRIAWRRMAAMATDVFMVLIWAAMIPAFMWLGAVAGF